MTGLLVAAACGSASDAGVLYEPWIPGPGPRQAEFLAFSSTYDGRGPAPVGAPGFPKRLSETGAFADAAALEPSSGIVPYDIRVPLWSDGAQKRRWVSVPEGQSLGYSEGEPLEIPVGTVFVKHFDMALDERFPDDLHRLETRFWIVATTGAQYGVTYKWNPEQTDADLLIAGETEMLSIVGADGQARTQSYSYPSPADCHTCHNAQAGFVLGARTAQLNRSVSYRLDRPPVEQLLSWSSWRLLDARLNSVDVQLAPKLTVLADEGASLEDRVRSYWDGNCAMCHAGRDGSVAGWDARHSTPLEDQGLFQAPTAPAATASELISPGSPEASFIHRRGDTAEPGLRMPPLGRSRVDDVYIDVLARWITSLAEDPSLPAE